MKDWFKLFTLEFKAVLFNPSHYVSTVFFYIGAALLFPLTLGVDPDQLSVISGSIVWVLYLLAILLVMKNLFFQDYQSGLLEQIIITGRSLPFWVFLKVIIYWLIIGLPLIIISPLIALSLYFDSAYLIDFYLLVALVSPSLFFLATISASFSVAIGGNFIVLALISFPLCIPVLIIAGICMQSLINGIYPIGLIKLLIAILLLTSTFCPLLSSKILRVLFQ